MIILVLNIGNKTEPCNFFNKVGVCVDTRSLAILFYITHTEKLYLGVYVYINPHTHALKIIKTESVNLKESKEGFLGQFGLIKGKEENL